MIVGIGGYTYLSGGKLEMNGNSFSVSKTTTNSSETITGTIEKIMAMGKTAKCTYKVNDIEAEGYIKNNMYRGKSNIPNQGLVDIIMKDNCMYAWSDKKQDAPGGYQGTKICFDEGMSMFGQNSGIRPDIEYKCSVTSVSDDIFEPPANIKFYDVDTQGFGIDESAEE